MNDKTIRELVGDADCLTYINALKASISEIKEEVSTIEETQDYQNNALKRTKTILRRMDNQYRAIVKAATSSASVQEGVEMNSEIIDLMEGLNDE